MSATASCRRNGSDRPHRPTADWFTIVVSVCIPAKRMVRYNYYFESAAIAVDSSHMTVSSTASWSRFSLPSTFVNGHVSTMWFVVCRWPQSQEGDWARPHLCMQASMTWALTCPETVHRRPCMTREMETWLSDSRVRNNSVIDHRSRRPVLSLLRNCLDRCHVWPHWASRCKTWRWMLKDISIHRPI